MSFPKHSVPISGRDIFWANVIQPLQVSPEMQKNNSPKNEFSRASIRGRPNRKSRHKDKPGPCGIPALDVDCVGPVNEANRVLTLPISLSELEDDFDFEANLALFDKNDLSPDPPTVMFSDQEAVFKHNENVITDPARIMTKLSEPCKIYAPCDMKKSIDGFIIPYLCAKSKALFLKHAEFSLGSAIFNDRVADRIHLFSLKIARKFKVNFGHVAIISSKTNDDQIVLSLCHYLCNVSSVVYLFGKNLKSTSSNLCIVEDLQEIPANELTLVIVICGVLTRPVIRKWLGSLPTTVHGVSLEKRSHLMYYEHLLMLGIGCKAEVNGRLVNEYHPHCLQAVADIGVSALRSSDPLASHLAEAFSNKCIVIL